MGIITLPQARASLRLPANQTVDDDDIQDLIDSATPLMEDICGPIVSRPCDDWFDGGWQTVMLTWAPVLSVTTVTEAYGAGYNRTLTEQPLDGSSFDAFGYTVDKVTGVIIRRVSGVAGSFINGRRNIHVVWTAGRPNPAPANLQRATRRLVRWLWQTEMQGQRPANQSPEKVAQTPSGYDVPLAVVKLCGADARIPGIG